MYIYMYICTGICIYIYMTESYIMSPLSLLQCVAVYFAVCCSASANKSVMYDGVFESIVVCVAVCVAECCSVSA